MDKRRTLNVQRRMMNVVVALLSNLEKQTERSDSIALGALAHFRRFTFEP